MNKQSLADSNERVGVPRISIALGLAVLASLPLSIAYWVAVFQSQQFYFVPIAWFAVLFLFWRRNSIAKGFCVDPIRRWSGLTVVLIAVLLALLSAVLLSSSISYLAFLLIATGGSLLFLGDQPWTRIVALCSLLWAAWALPFGISSNFANWLHSNAIISSSYILDLAGVMNFATATSIDISSLQMQKNELLVGADSFQALLAVCILMLLIGRQPLALGLLSVLAVPCISWFADVALIVFHVTAMEGWASNLTFGWPGVSIKLCVFCIEIGLVYCVVSGISFLLEPVPVAHAGEDRRGWHGILNSILIWPMKMKEAGKSGDGADNIHSYYADDEGGELADTRMVRVMPSRHQVASAPDPYQEHPHVYITTIGLASLSVVLSVLAISLPAPGSGQAMNVSQLEVPEELFPSKLGRLEFVSFQRTSKDEAIWNYQADGGAASLAVKTGFGVGDTQYSIGEWSLDGPVGRYEGQIGVVREAVYVDALGNRSYAWAISVDRSGETLSIGKSWWHRLGRRLNDGLYGRLVGGRLPDKSFQMQLFIRSGRVLSRLRQEEYREAFEQAGATLRLAIHNGQVSMSEEPK